MIMGVLAVFEKNILNIFEYEHQGKKGYTQGY